MLEQCHARFLPQAMTKQKRRVDGGGQHGSSYRLRQIVMSDEIRWARLKVHLEACVARLHHDVVVRDLKLIQSLDMDGKRSAAQTNYAAIYSR